MKIKLIIYIFLLVTVFEFSSCGRRPRTNTSRSNKTEQRQISQSSRRDRTRSSYSRKGKAIIKMQKRDGVYYIPCKINGSEMQFVFDTGASDITMSATEALFLYKQGKISEADFIGTAEYQIADGSVGEGTVINLRTVTIGSITLYNVKASIIHNMEAPLLLGQSALAKFGKISIDYKANEIIFE